MKRNWIRLLSILLTAVMIFPAASFAYAAGEGGTIPLFTGEKYALANELSDAEKEVLAHWVSLTDDVVSVDEETGEVTALKAGEKVGIVKAYTQAYEEIETFTFVVTDPTPLRIKITEPTKLDYYSGDALDTSGLKVTVVYNNNKEVDVTTGYSVEPVEEDLDVNSLSAGPHDINVTYGTLAPVSFRISVQERKPLSIEIVDEKTQYKVGESFMGAKVRVNYNDGTHDILVSGYTVTPELAAKGTTKYTVSYRGFEHSKNITVIDDSGSGSGSGTTDPEKLTVKVTKQPNKKDYTI
ncbi:MAG: bacterial Ig-like domain-containing protein, partial [Clostridia bacterium]|nr:bacterial Ig-like domain-containing protein [Clostridia bacterium]